jgi:predicted ester cyclase/uncharacterized glyoxalase superfamily protein PhnB
MTTDVKAAARNFYATINEALATGNLSLLDGVVAVDAVDHNPDPGMKQGLAGIKQAFAASRVAFPDFRFDVEEIVAEGDRAACRLTVRGTHGGAFLGLAPTGRSVMFPVVDILRIAAGKLVERWGVFDGAILLQQLGAAGPQKHVRHGVGSVRPYVYGPPALLELVTQAFGASVVERIDEGSGAHVEVRIGDAMIVLELGEFDGIANVTRNSIYVYVDGVDAVYERALRAGATSIAPPEDKPYRERQAGVRDGFGNVWWIGTYMGDRR